MTDVADGTGSTDPVPNAAASWIEATFARQHWSCDVTVRHKGLY